jgi:hypothetical protein
VSAGKGGEARRTAELRLPGVELVLCGELGSTSDRDLSSVGSEPATLPINESNTEASVSSRLSACIDRTAMKDNVLI